MSSADREGRDDQAAFAGTVPNHIRDYVFRDSFAPCDSVSADCPEYTSVCDIRCCHPSVDSALYPDRHRNRANMATLSNEIHDCPMALPDLDVFFPERHQFRSSEPAPKEDGDHGKVTKATEALPSAGGVSLRPFSDQPRSPVMNFVIEPPRRRGI